MNRFLFGLIFLVLSACRGEKFSPLEITQAQLIGGSPQSPAQLRGTVQIYGNCTAAKVGKKIFILAAHCLLQSGSTDLKDQYRAGGRIWIRPHYLKDWIAVHVHKTYIHPEFSAQILKMNDPVDAGLFAPDLAFFTVEEETPEIEKTFIDQHEIQPNEEVVIGGYGCEDDRMGATFDYSKSRYKTHREKILPEDEIFLQDPWEGSNALKAQNYAFFTPGQDSDPLMASLCPGDSGGPVYRSSTMGVIGVNSYYLFKSERSTISWQNTHARIDNQAKWLKEVAKDSEN